MVWKNLRFCAFVNPPIVTVLHGKVWFRQFAGGGVRFNLLHNIGGL